MSSTPQGHDPLDARVVDEPLGDLVGGWADELRTAVVSDLPDVKIEALADLATAAVVTSAGAAATAAGTSAVGITGGQPVSSLFTTTIAKFVASATIAASLGTGGAIAGVLPDSLQNGAADVADVVGIDLPRPDVTTDDVTIDVDGAGEVVVEVVDGVLGIVDFEASSDWQAEVLARTDSRAVIEFASDNATKTVTVATDAAGRVTSDVQDTTVALVDSVESSAVEFDTDAAVGVGVDGESTEPAGGDAPSSGAGGEIRGSGTTGAVVEAPGVDASIDAEAELDAGGGVGLGG